jgi:hypothetical protein
MPKLIKLPFGDSIQLVARDLAMKISTIHLIFGSNVTVMSSKTNKKYPKVEK